MIEVEKKFYLNPEQEAKLVEGAEFMGEYTNHDVYYDLDDFSLTKRCHWLRKRNNNFELKKRAHDLKPAGFSGVYMYDEIEDEQRIAETLQIEYSGNLETDLKENGYHSFSEYTVTRRSYKRDLFRIDFDSCDFGYAVIEIERLVEDDSQKQQALEEINTFAEEIGIDTTPATGKLIEYLKRFSPDHYKTLQDAGVVE